MAPTSAVRPQCHQTTPILWPSRSVPSDESLVLDTSQRARRNIRSHRWLEILDRHRRYSTPDVLTLGSDLLQSFYQSHMGLGTGWAWGSLPPISHLNPKVSAFSMIPPSQNLQPAAPRTKLLLAERRRWRSLETTVRWRFQSWQQST